MVVVAVGVISISEKRCFSVTEVECLGYVCVFLVLLKGVRTMHRFRPVSFQLR